MKWRIKSNAYSMIRPRVAKGQEPLDLIDGRLVEVSKKYFLT